MSSCSRSRPRAVCRSHIGLRYTGFKPFRMAAVVEGGREGPGREGGCSCRQVGRLWCSDLASTIPDHHALYLNLRRRVLRRLQRSRRRRESQVIPTLVWATNPADREHQRESAGVRERERVFERPDGSRRADRHEVSVQPRDPSPSRQPDFHVRVHRERAEREQHARRRFAARSSLACRLRGGERRRWP